MDAPDIARKLRQISRRLHLRDDTLYRARAYEQAALMVEGHADDLAERIARGTLTELDGIGTTTARTITELWHTGKSDYLGRLEAEIPDGVLQVAAIHGIGPKRAMALFRSLRITSPAELKGACLEHRVQALPGFAAKLEQRLLEAVMAWEGKRGTAAASAAQMPLPLGTEAHGPA
jgi:DNA polymerase (family 10)